jgi:hypothetical protein
MFERGKTFHALDRARTVIMSGGIAPCIIDSALDSDWFVSRSGLYTLRERTLCTLGLSAILDAVENKRFLYAGNRTVIF